VAGFCERDDKGIFWCQKNQRFSHPSRRVLAYQKETLVHRASHFFTYSLLVYFMKLSIAKII
jgi:hypothetical protein